VFLFSIAKPSKFRIFELFLAAEAIADGSLEFRKSSIDIENQGNTLLILTPTHMQTLANMFP
jgi:hypothetical protein